MKEGKICMCAEDSGSILTLASATSAQLMRKRLTKYRLRKTLIWKRVWAMYILGQFTPTQAFNSELWEKLKE